MASVTKETIIFDTLINNSGYHFYKQMPGTDATTVVSSADLLLGAGSNINVMTVKGVEEDGTTEFELDPTLATHLKELFTVLRAVQLGTDETTNIKTAYDFVMENNDIVAFSETLASEINLEEKKQEFKDEKNKLITMMAKNKNIYTKLGSNNFYYYILLAVLSIYTLGTLFLYVQSGGQSFVPNVMDLKVTYTLLIGLCSLVLTIFVIIDIYQLVTRKNYESFTSPSTTIENPTIDDLLTVVLDYLSRLPIIIEYDKQLRNDINTNKEEVIHSILNDFNNINYVNMRRYQITDYKINESRSRVHFVKYAFLVVSLIGILAGLYLRSGDTSIIATVYVNKAVFTYISAFLVFSYILIIMLNIKQNKIRRKYNWNKLYWNVKAINEKK
jgi:hypothetical protein